GERGRRRRRRGGRDREDVREGAAPGEAAVADLEPVVAGESVPATPDAAVVAEEAAGGDERREREGGRRRRGGRDRHRREERPVESLEGAGAEAPDTAARLGEEAVDVSAAWGAANGESLLAASAPLLAEPVAAAIELPVVVAAPTPAPVEPFALPIDELAALARDAGLEWVGSDAEKIRLAQEAIAAAPMPAHVPRERKPVPVLDEGPLVLVETRKDLSQVRLPFEAPQP
ncbi:MAG TPA: ribonuclease E/G, partial [Ideonella sp.]|nr:ribonuclease E/G [Ideonella sp.]